MYEELKSEVLKYVLVFEKLSVNVSRSVLGKEGRGEGGEEKVGGGRGVR